MRTKGLSLSLSILIILIILPLLTTSPSVSSTSSWSADYSNVVSQVNMTRVEGNIQRFVGFGSRVSGYPGCVEAAQFIYNEFKGLVNVSYENYDLAIPYDYGANITVLPSGEVIRAYPLWPNLIETCAIEPQGIEGPLIYAGDGDLSDYHDRINGTIVLMSFNSMDKWVYAAEFGAKAVIFIANETTSVDATAKTIGLPLNFPRLYISRADGTYLLNLLRAEGTFDINVKSLLVYKNVEAKNVVGYIRGSDPELSKQVVIISAYYDSMSVVPSIAPGAQEACGISVLLELARFFSQPQNQPKRTIMFLAVSGHNQALAGAREFVHRHINEIGNKLSVLINLDLNTKSDSLGVFYWSYFYTFRRPIARYSTISNLIFDTYLPQIETQLKKQYSVDNCIHIR